MSSTKKEDYDTMVKKWILLDQQLKQMNGQMKELREAKADVSDKISQYLETNHIEHIDTSQGKIRPIERKEYTPLTYGFLERSLEKIITDKSKIQHILIHLKNSRDIKIVKELSFDRLSKN